jgi:hypothetical protein
MMDARLGAAVQRAVALDVEGKRDQAEFLLREVIRLDPDSADALHILALMTGHGQRLEEGLALVDRAVAIDPRRASFLRTQCEFLRRLGRYAAAEAAGRAAMEWEPTDHVAPTILGAIAYHNLDLTQAVTWAEHALKLEPSFPEAHFELGKALLIQGEFARGWEENESRFSIASAPPLMPPLPQPQWNGEKLLGKLLLIADQGFGDSIQFMRYIPWAQSICPDMALAIDDAIRPLVARTFPDLQQFTNWDEMPDFVAYCPLSGLPRLHRTDLATVPVDIPYLYADLARAASWADRLRAVCPPGARRVGLAWAGRPTHNDDMNRSMKLGALAELAEIPGIAWVALQKGPAREQMSGVSWPAPFIDIGHATMDFDDTVAVIAGLDMVLTVDTVIAHLAGAMGKPVWIMLPFAPDWRWMITRTDSPWYPSARLFRQAAPKDWASVVSAVKRALV